MNLSDKIIRNNLPDDFMPWLDIEDVKEFIKELKNDIYNTRAHV